MNYSIGHLIVQSRTNEGEIFEFGKKTLLLPFALGRAIARGQGASSRRRKHSAATGVRGGKSLQYTFDKMTTRKYWGTSNLAQSIEDDFFGRSRRLRFVRATRLL